jgi:hypothetical protein
MMDQPQRTAAKHDQNHEERPRHHTRVTISSAPHPAASTCNCKPHFAAIRIVGQAAGLPILQAKASGPLALQ